MMSVNLEVGRDAQIHVIIEYFHHTNPVAANNF